MRNNGNALKRKTQRLTRTSYKKKISRIFAPIANLFILFFFSFNFLFRITVGLDNQYNQQGGLVYQPQGQSDISPPVFEKIFKNARFAQGGNALFEGKLRGNPKPVVSWTRKGAPLLASNKYQINYNENTGDVSGFKHYLVSAHALNCLWKNNSIISYGNNYYMKIKFNCRYHF